MFHQSIPFERKHYTAFHMVIKLHNGPTNPDLVPSVFREVVVLMVEIEAECRILPHHGTCSRVLYCQL